MIIEKKYAKSYEVLGVAVTPMFNYYEFMKYRKLAGMPTKGLTKCFKCGHKFVDYEGLYPVVLKSEKSRFFCEECAVEFNNK